MWHGEMFLFAICVGCSVLDVCASLRSIQYYNGDLLKLCKLGVKCKLQTTLLVHDLLEDGPTSKTNCPIEQCNLSLLVGREAQGFVKVWFCPGVWASQGNLGNGYGMAVWVLVAIGT